MKSFSLVIAGALVFGLVRSQFTWMVTTNSPPDPSAATGNRCNPLSGGWQPTRTSPTTRRVYFIQTTSTRRPVAIAAVSSVFRLSLPLNLCPARSFCPKRDFATLTQNQSKSHLNRSPSTPSLKHRRIRAFVARTEPRSISMARDDHNIIFCHPCP